MASSKPPPDSHDIKKPQPYSPVTSSPLNPGSSSSTSKPPPRRNTISSEPTASTSTPKPPCTTRSRHRRRTWSSLSPTERLLRYKAAAAWRSATLRTNTLHNPPHTCHDNNNNNNNDNDNSSEKDNNNGNETPKTKTTSPIQHHSNPDFNLVTPKPPNDNEKAPPPTVAKYYHTQECADYTTAIFRPRRHQGHMYTGNSRATTIARARGTRLQRVSVITAVLLVGVYLLLGALVAVFYGSVGWCRLTA